ncbi:MAG: hypothetical protein V1664_05045 [Candidatus Uhrbacteria bacterium]
MKYPIVLWDADGVTLKNSRLFSEQLEIDYGIKTETVLPFFKGVFRECSVGRADLKVELAKVIGEWGWPGTVGGLMDYWFSKGTLVDQEMIKFIETVRDSGSRCFMTTDQEKYRGEYLKNLLGNGQPFEKIFYSAEIGTLKKDPLYFDYIYRFINETLSDTPLDHSQRINFSLSMMMKKIFWPLKILVLPPIFFRVLKS